METVSTRTAYRVVVPDGAEAGLALEWTYRTGDHELDAESERLRQCRAEIDAASTELAVRTGALARRLVSEHRFSVREAATLLGLSPARVDQLVREGAGRSGGTGGR